MKRGLPIYLILSGLCLSSIAAQREMTPEEVEQRERMRHTVLLPFKYITDFGADNGGLNMLQIRPLYTLSTENWNFINRPIISFGKEELTPVVNPGVGRSFENPATSTESSGYHRVTGRANLRS